MILAIKKYFQLDACKTTIKKEIIGGITTFLAMSYILAVQPGMIASATSLPYGGIYLSTVISSFVATFAMGLLANVPIALAPGMGINAFFAYTVCGILKIDVYQALSVVLISGWLYFLLAVTPARKYISQAFSKNLKLAIGVGIGIFIGFIGLQETGIIQSDASTIVAKDGKLVTLSPVSVKLGNFKNPLVLLSIFVLFLMLSLYFLKVWGGIILTMIMGIIVMAIMYGAGVKALTGPTSPFQLNDFGSQFKGFGQIAGQSYKHIGAALQNPLCYIAIFVFLYTDFFDTTGTLFVIDQTAKFSQRDPHQKWLKRANIADAAGTVFGASIGSTTVTSFAESEAGVALGARTGLAALCTGSLFLLTIFLYPIIKPLMPITNNITQAGVTRGTISPITGPALIVIGILMMMQLKEFDWKEMIDVPVLFVVILFTALTYSIASGIAAGIITFTILNLVMGLKQLIGEKYHLHNKPVQVPGANKTLISKVSKMNKPTYPNYLKRLNGTMIILFIISMVYFGTTILYFGY